MARRVSQLVYFFLELLYGRSRCVSWYNEEEYVFCWDCLRKNKKGFSSMHAEVFERYHLLKRHNSEKSSNDKRQTLLQALKKSPFFKEIEELSTKDKKFYKIVKINKEELETIRHELTQKFIIETADIEIFSESQGAANGVLNALSSSAEYVDIDQPSDLSSSEEVESGSSVTEPGLFSNDDYFESFLHMETSVAAIQEVELRSSYPNVTEPVASDASFYPETTAAPHLFNCEGYKPDLYDMAALEDVELSGEIRFDDSGSPQFIPDDYDPETDLIQALPASAAGGVEKLDSSLLNTSSLNSAEIYNITVTDHGLRINNFDPSSQSALYMLVLPSQLP